MSMTVTFEYDGAHLAQAHIVGAVPSTEFTFAALSPHGLGTAETLVAVTADFDMTIPDIIHSTIGDKFDLVLDITEGVPISGIGQLGRSTCEYGSVGGQYSAGTFNWAYDGDKTVTLNCDSVPWLTYTLVATTFKAANTDYQNAVSSAVVGTGGGIDLELDLADSPSAQFAVRVHTSPNNGTDPGEIEGYSAQCRMFNPSTVDEGYDVPFVDGYTPFDRPVALLHWTEVDAPVTSGAGGVTGIRCPEIGKVVGVVTDFTIPVSVIVSSDHGDSWDQPATPAPGFDLGGGFNYPRACAWDGVTALLILGAGGYVVTSTDADTFTADPTSPFSSASPDANVFGASAAFGNGRFVLGAQATDCPCIVSAAPDDLATWTEHPSPFDGGGVVTWLGYIEAWSLWVAGGTSPSGNGMLCTSPNLTTWTERTTPFSGGSGQVYSAYYSGRLGRLVAVGYGPNPSTVNDYASSTVISAATPGTWEYHGCIFDSNFATSVVETGDRLVIGGNIAGNDAVCLIDTVDLIDFYPYYFGQFPLNLVGGQGTSALIPGSLIAFGSNGDESVIITTTPVDIPYVPPAPPTPPTPPIPGLLSIYIAPASAALRQGQTLKLKAVGVYDDGFIRNISSIVTWSTDDPTVATVGPDGLVTAIR